MSILAVDDAVKEKYLLQAHELKTNILRHFYNPSTGVYQLDKTLPASGICQDVKAHAVTLDLLPHHTNDLEQLTDPGAGLPRAFRGLGHWDVANVVSPYASGYAVEALFARDRGMEAINLIKRVWGPMADTTSPNYSGGHWEALKPSGTPHGHDTSLMHGWSTWPVSLLPRYLAGLEPLEPGWKSFRIAPVLAGLTQIKCVLATVAGDTGVDIEIEQANGHGALKVLAPYGVRVQLQAPQGWVIQGSESVEGTGLWQKFFMSEIPEEKDLDTIEGMQTSIAKPSYASAPKKGTFPRKLRSLLSCFTATAA